MSESVAIWWIRRDLRLLDQPALSAAAAAGSVVPVFVLDDGLQLIARHELAGRHRHRRTGKGNVTTQSGAPFQVFTPFYRAWLRHGWRAPADTDPARISWTGLPGDPLPTPSGQALEATEQAAIEAWERFRHERLPDYPTMRDRPDLNGTSRLSTYLRWGLLHPRTRLADLGPDDEVFRKELAWREFYAAVLAHWPASARDYFRPELQELPYLQGDLLTERLTAWQEGRTGYPIVDAAMRQLNATGWMHNRLRMITASFLVKDLHIEWQHGARYFMANLTDGDLASNQHGWQWAAGSGTDAAPYFRIFNPTTQAKHFDPNGDFVRTWIPELAHLSGSAIHEPWRAKDAGDYPPPIVDHAEQRAAALDAYAALRGR